MEDFINFLRNVKGLTYMCVLIYVHTSTEIRMERLAFQVHPLVVTGVKPTSEKKFL